MREKTRREEMKRKIVGRVHLNRLVFQKRQQPPIGWGDHFFHSINDRAPSTRPAVL